MNRILVEVKLDSVIIKNVNPGEETVEKTVLNYSLLQGPSFTRLDLNQCEQFIPDLVKAGRDSFIDSTVYLIFPQSLFHTLTLPAKPELSKLQQYNEHKFEISIIFPFLESDAFSLDVQTIAHSGFNNPDSELVTVINNDLLNFASMVKKNTNSPRVKIIVPFLSLKEFIKKNFPDEQKSVLLHISGNSIILASLRGAEIASVYSTNFIDIPSIPDIIDSFLLNNSSGRIDKDTLSNIYFSLEEYKVGLASLVEKWMNIKTVENFAGLPLGKVCKIPPDLLAEIRNEA